MSEKFPVEKFYVSHFTRIHNLENIIKARALQPRIFQEDFNSYYYEQAEELGNQEKYKKSIFYSIIFPDSKGIPIYRDEEFGGGQAGGGQAYFIFSPKIIEDNANMLNRRYITELPIFCKGWNYGKTDIDKCDSYDINISLYENLNKWRNTVKESIRKYEEDPYQESLVSVESNTLGTELLMEGEMPIDMDLVVIYVPEQIIYQYTEEQLKKKPFLKKVQDGLRMEAEEVETLIKENPDLPWTRENPFK
jgi:hypothetical protein